MTISPAATASDVDNSDLVFGVVRIAGGWVDGDVLTVNGLQSGTFAGIDFSYNAALHALVFRQPAPVGDFQALMQAVQFGSTSENPTNFGANPTRTLGWGLHDGDDYSYPVQLTQITINAIDDPAMAQNDAVGTAEDTAITAGNVFANNGSGLDNDPDGGAFLVTAVSGGTLGTQLTLPSGALLTVNADGTFSYDPNHMFDYLPTPGSGASNLTITDTFSYTITGGDTATVTVTVSGVDTDDTLRDSPGIDSLAGGIGDDYYYVNNTDDVVTEAAGAGFDTVVASVNLHTAGQQHCRGAQHARRRVDRHGLGRPRNADQQLRTQQHADRSRWRRCLLRQQHRRRGDRGGDRRLRHRSCERRLHTAGQQTVELLNMLGPGLTGTGSDGAETFISSFGSNTLEGLGGDDYYYVNHSRRCGDRERRRRLRHRGRERQLYTAGQHQCRGALHARLRLTGRGSDDADTLLSSGGPNTLVGLGGDDLYYVNNADDVVIEEPSGGYDTVVATVNYTLPANVEALYMIRLRVDRHGLGRRRHVCSAAVDPTRWSGLAAMISITSTTPTTW